MLKKIPEKVIQNAVGLAIFTTMRTGLWLSGAGGSGVLIARQENGEWSPPSGIMLHTAGLGFLVGVDIYDCVLVINNRKALDSFTAIRATVGGEISAVAGPVGVGGVLENDGKWKQAKLVSRSFVPLRKLTECDSRPVFTYLKSRGLYAGVQVDGTVIIERSDENERFYGQRIGVTDILAGKVRHPPYELKKLMETLKAAEGRSDVDQGLIRELDNEPAPGDVEIGTPTRSSIFGVPEPDDPDPFGVLALEKFGLEIKEAGTKTRPSSTQFEFNPAPSSPLYGKFQRRSMDTLMTTRSNRESMISVSNRNSSSYTTTSTQTIDMSTQTDGPISPKLSPTRRSTEKIVEEDEKRGLAEPEEIDYTKIDLGPYSSLSKNHSQEFDGTTVNESPLGSDGQEGRRGSIGSIIDSDDEEEEPVIFEVASSQATIITPRAIKARGGLVDIPKRIPPPLPPRSNARNSRAMVDQSNNTSPSKEDFEEVDIHGVSRPSSLMDSRQNSPISDTFKNPELPPRRSLQAGQSLTMDDLEKITSLSSDGGEKTLEKKIEAELKEQKLDEISPVTTQIASSTPVVVVEPITLQKNVEKEVSMPGEFKDEHDEFHSLPPTPGEIQVK